MPPKRRKSVRSARTIGAGHGITPERLDFARPRSLGHARNTQFIKLLADSHGRLVSPATHREPAQNARKSNEWRDRRILHLVALPGHILAQAALRRNPHLRDQRAQGTGLKSRIAPK